MIHTVTLLLLRKALADCARLPPAIGLSFNLSAHDLASPETVVAILAAVRRSGLDPRRLTLELTETALMRDFEQAKAAITTLRALGIKIALDDFGTGYSSLGYVHRLPLDKIKIDRASWPTSTPTGAAVWSPRSWTSARTSASTASPRGSRRPTSSRRRGGTAAATSRATSSASRCHSSIFLSSSGSMRRWIPQGVIERGHVRRVRSGTPGAWKALSLADVAPSEVLSTTPRRPCPAAGACRFGRSCRPSGPREVLGRRHVPLPGRSSPKRSRGSGPIQRTIARAEAPFAVPGGLPKRTRPARRGFCCATWAFSDRAPARRLVS